MELHCSQTVCFVHFLSDSLRPLWNYTALKLDSTKGVRIDRFETPMELHCSQTSNTTRSIRRDSLRPLWNYTALKPTGVTTSRRTGLRPLWNYTALKLGYCCSFGRCCLRPLWNYTALKLCPLSALAFLV